MAGNIKGITVEIGGDTTSLVKALSGVNKEIRNTQADLKQVERLLKLDPTNIELLSQKQRLLSETIESTEKKLQSLKNASVQAAQALASGDLGQDKYDALQREIIKTEQSLNSLKTEASTLSSSLSKSSKGLEDLGNAAEKASQKLGNVSKVAAGLGGAIIATVPATQELRRDLSFLEINAKSAGVGMGNAETAFEKFNAVSGETDSSIEATSNLLKAGFTKSNLQTAVEGLAGAAIQFPGTLKIESLADSLQETLATGQATGQFGELLDRVGIGADNFSAGLANCTTEAEKQNYALEALSKAGLNDTYNQWVNGNKELVEYETAMLNMQQALGGLATAIAPLVTTIVNFATAMLEKFNSLPESVKIVAAVFLGLVAAIGPVSSIISFLVTHFTSLGTVFNLIRTVIPLLTAAFSAISAPVLIVIGVITALVTIFTTLWTTNESFRTTVINVWNAISAFFTQIFAQIQGIFSAFVSLIGAIWDQWGTRIYNVVSTIFSAISSIIQTILSTIQSIIRIATALINGDWSGAWEEAKSLVSNIWENIKSLVSNALSNLASTISGAASSIYSAVTKAFSSAISYLTSLPSKALQWGKDFIQGFINGITSKISAAINAIQSFGNKIRSLLHFSRPDTGPLRDYENWMPDFMAGLARGIKENEYLVTNAVSGLARNMSNSIYQETQAPIIDYGQIYSAFKAASRETSFKIILDSRELGRGLRGMGVVFD